VTFRANGFGAALIMALAMAASVSTPRPRSRPTSACAASRRPLAEELEETEMFLTLCYAVARFGAGPPTYAQSGIRTRFWCRRTPGRLRGRGHPAPPRAWCGGEERVLRSSAQGDSVSLHDGFWPDARGRTASGSASSRARPRGESAKSAARHVLKRYSPTRRVYRRRRLPTTTVTPCLLKVLRRLGQHFLNDPAIWGDVDALDSCAGRARAGNWTGARTLTQGAVAAVERDRDREGRQACRDAQARHCK